MIHKPTVIITSLGRTGTSFFAYLLSNILSDTKALHEPDTFHLDLHRLLGQIQESGIKNIIFRKAIGKWSMASLSHARIKGELPYQEAVEKILSQRKDYIHSKTASLYVESTLAYYGLIDVFGDVFEQHRVLFLIRDGREWVRSKMNRAEMYNRGKVRELFAHSWPTAKDFPGDPYQSEWDSLPRFEKLCWAWTKLNTYALQGVNASRHSRLVRFEDIFEHRDRYKNLREIVQFAVSFPGLEISHDAVDGWLERRINVSDGVFPSWDRWTEQQKARFQLICGGLMRKIGYSID